MVSEEINGMAFAAIDVVIIGVNVENTLKDCIDSVLITNYPQELLHLYYVDGGSKDHSVAIAKNYPQVNVIELHDPHPTPGKGRNAGWRAGSANFVQFLDADTQLAKNWLETALVAFQQKKIAAVCGSRNERFPAKSLYNWIAEQEWNPPAGYIQAFGGDVMIRRSALEATGGYNDVLVGGEDPELSLRICHAGDKILKLAAPMTVHDLAMSSWRQYWRRAYRTGYAYAAVNAMHGHISGFWQDEIIRILARGGGAILLMFAAIVNVWWLLPALLLLFFPIFKVKKFCHEKSLSVKEGVVYALHCSFVVVPQFFGILRYYLGVLFAAPLKNMVAQPR